MFSQKDKILLHCCCAPCTLLPHENLVDQGWQVTLYYYNPNIHPQAEYELRLHTLQEYADAHEIPLSVGAYDPNLWEQRVGIYGGPYPLITEASNFEEMESAKRRRCTACYQLRFDVLADYGAAAGYATLDATLTISPYQFTQEVKKALNNSATKHTLHALDSDWQSFYAAATQKSRALGMYRQNYCGCRFSKKEAELEREARKLARKESRRNQC